MTKEEYNETLKTFHKAMNWYNSNPSVARQEQFYDKFVAILEQLTIGFNELNPKGKEILEGFEI